MLGMIYVAGPWLEMAERFRAAAATTCQLLCSFYTASIQLLYTAGFIDCVMEKQMSMEIK